MKLGVFSGPAELSGSEPQTHVGRVEGDVVVDLGPGATRPRTARRAAGRGSARRRDLAPAVRGRRLRRLLLVARARDEHGTHVPSRREPLLPNWRHLPVGYHGRAGTVVVSGTDDPPAARAARRGRLRPDAEARRRARAGLRDREACAGGRSRSTARSSTCSAPCSSTTGARATSRRGSRGRSARSSASRSRPRSRRG